jgi:hypothetical protein
MAGGIMSTQYLSDPVVAGYDAEPPLLFLTLACGPVTVIELCSIRSSTRYRISRD